MLLPETQVPNRQTRYAWFCLRKWLYLWPYHNGPFWGNSFFLGLLIAANPSNQQPPKVALSLAALRWVDFERLRPGTEGVPVRCVWTLIYTYLEKNVNFVKNPKAMKSPMALWSFRNCFGNSTRDQKPLWATTSHCMPLHYKLLKTSENCKTIHYKPLRNGSKPPFEMIEIAGLPSTKIWMDDGAVSAYKSCYWCSLIGYLPTMVCHFRCITIVIVIVVINLDISLWFWEVFSSINLVMVMFFSACSGCSTSWSTTIDSPKSYEAPWRITVWITWFVDSSSIIELHGTYIEPSFALHHTRICNDPYRLYNHQSAPNLPWSHVKRFAHESPQVLQPGSPDDSDDFDDRLDQIGEIVACCFCVFNVAVKFASWPSMLDPDRFDSRVFSLSFMSTLRSQIPLLLANDARSDLLAWVSSAQML